MESTASPIAAFRELMARLRRSLANPQLVGEAGGANRYLKVQWWVTFWRLLILLEIPLFALVSPDSIGSPAHAAMLFGGGLIYTAGFSLVATRTRLGGNLWLHVIDIAASSSLMLLSLNRQLVYVTAFYAYSSLLARPTTRVMVAMPATVILSLAYLQAEAWTGITIDEFIASFYDLSDFLLFYFFGLGFVGFSLVLDRASALELDSHLDKQRHDYRRRLHDDLGNTLCGLHFKIQSLKRSRRQELSNSLEFLSAGYDRANQVLERLLSGLEEKMTGNLGDSLAGLKREAEASGSVRIALELSPAGIKLSPEVEREVVTISREAITNALQHANAGEIRIMARQHGGRLHVSVDDDGDGFLQSDLADRQRAGSLGIITMQERAKLLGGNLTCKTSPGAGTMIDLDIRTADGPRLISRLLEYQPRETGGGLFPFVVKLRIFMFVAAIAQLLIGGGEYIFSPPIVAVTLIIGIDCLAFAMFRDAVYELINRRPWLLIIEQAVFASMYYVCLSNDVPAFLANYVGVSIIINGSVFIGAVGNFALVSFLDIGILLSYLLVPETSAIAMQGNRLMEAVQECTTNLIIGVSAGLAGEFVDGLEGLQIRAIGRALARQRERLSAETHRQLHALVHGLGKEIHSLSGLLVSGEVGPRQIDVLETRSGDLKKRLRATLVSLEEAD